MSAVIQRGLDSTLLSNVFLLNRMAQPPEGCDIEARIECSVLHVICSFLQRNDLPRAHDAPDERIPGATGWAGVPAQHRQPVGTSALIRGIVNEGMVSVSIGGHVTGGDFLKSGCRLLRAGVDEVLGVVPQFAKYLLGAEGYRTVHKLERRELSNARWSAVLCLPQSSWRRSHWWDCDRRVCVRSTWHLFSQRPSSL